MRGIATLPVALAVVIIAAAAAYLAYQWHYAQQKAAERAALLAAKLNEEQQRCLSAVVSVAGNATVVAVGGEAHAGNYTGLGCYVDRDVVILVQWRR
ncbi:MAG: hypothetical protein LM577_05535 [Thermoproteaceae archaeon]|nr:hypothetical protein [Thermoproteaceae archaeon]